MGVNVTSPDYSIFMLAVLFYGQHLHVVWFSSGAHALPGSCRGLPGILQAIGWLTMHNLKDGKSILDEDEKWIP